jgi:hypothetical protein
MSGPPSSRTPKDPDLSHQTNASAEERRDARGAATLPADVIGTIRDTRAQLRAAAQSGSDDTLALALASFVGAAWDAGFPFTTTWSIAATALEEGFRPLPIRARRARAAAWTVQARSLHEALARSAAPDRQAT